MNTVNVNQSLYDLASRYLPFKTTIDRNILSSLTQLANSFEQTIAQAERQGRLLRIGIIGQIKRGKSSFLNSLLFNGQDILPKAATPMTAALTRISYSEQPQATVEFYTQQEWDKVLNTAGKVEKAEKNYKSQLEAFQNSQRQAPGQRRARQRPLNQPKHSDEEKACCELVRMVTKSGINVADYLGRNQQIKGVASNSDLVEQLSDYVGADGDYTPIVKSTELKLNIEGLQGIEVVDTPGMNDPIISRGRRTQEFIGQCDVVFFLSYCSQFMDMHDMGLLAQNIPNKGIKDIVLIGSVFDSALLDEYHNYPSIQQALPAITGKLNEVARKNVELVCHEGRQNQENEGYIFQALQNALPPIFISSRCFDLATKGEALNEEEAHTLNNLNRMYPDFQFSSDALLAVANFARVNQKLELVREQKDRILAERVDGIVQGAQREARQILSSIQADITYRKKRLEEGDLEALAAQQQKATMKIEAGQAKITSAFERQIANAQKIFRESASQLKQIAQNARRVETESGSRQESYQTSREVSTSKWYNPFSWGSTETVYETHYRTINYTYANVQGAVDKLETFIYKTDEQLNEASAEAVNLNQLKTDIKQVIKSMFDFSEEGFDPEAVLLPLETALARITMPYITLDLDHYIETIQQQFTSAEVENDDIARLRKEQARIIGLLLDEINSEVDKNVEHILNQLKQEESLFIPELTKDLKLQVERLREDLQHRQEQLNDYNEVLRLLAEDLQA